MSLRGGEVKNLAGSAATWDSEFKLFSGVVAGEEGATKLKNGFWGYQHFVYFDTSGSQFPLTIQTGSK